MAVEPKLMTAAELERMPRPPDGTRHELVYGELRTMAPVGWEHGRLTRRFDRSLGDYVEAHDLGEVCPGDVGFRLTTAPDTVRAPDVVFISRERLETAGRVRGFWPGAPDLVIEVISPNDLYTEVDEKVAMWLAFGVRLVLVANPRRRAVAVHRPGQPVRVLTGDDVLDGEDVVPGWTLALSDLFRDIG
jgi:Uma2 family endonuclease